MVTNRVSPPPTPLFLVQRLAWWVGLTTTNRTVEYGHQEKDGGVPVAVFSSHDCATALAGELTVRAQAELSPFLFMYPGDLERLSSKSEAAWKCALKEAGLEPPTKTAFDDGYGAINWQAWYDSLVGELTDAQRQLLWQLCDRLKLYEVVPIKGQG